MDLALNKRFAVVVFVIPMEIGRVVYRARLGAKICNN
jgi:hypothetical protein